MDRDTILLVLIVALITNLLIAVLPAKLMLLSILGVLLIVWSLINPFSTLLLIILMRLIGLPMPAVAVGPVYVGLGKVLGGLLVAILLVEGIVKRNLGFVRHPQTKLFFCFILVASISSIFAEEKDIALSEVISYLTGFLIYLLLVNLIKSRMQVSVLISVLIASGVLLILLEVSAMYGLIPYNRLLLAEIAEGGGEYRFGSFYAQPNELAIYLAVLTPIVVYSLLRFKSWIKKAFILLILIIFLASIFLTASRSGVLVLVFALLFTLKRKHVVLWFSIFLLLTVILLFIPAEHITRLSTLTTLLPGSSSPEPNIALRFEFIKAGFKIFLKNPILGVGPGNYDYQIVAYGLDRKPAHNVYVSVLAEMGFTGFVIYLLLYYVIFRDYLRAIKTISRFDTELKNMVESLFLSFLVFAVGQMTNVYPIDTFFVTIVSLCVALRTIFSRYDMVA